ncbi:MAG: PQQ-dependent sugar dehydrogenase [Bacteroidota bacterium]
MKIIYTFLVAVFLCSACDKAASQPQNTKITTREVVKNLNFPWEILWGPDNHIWYTERGGKVSRLNPETGVTQLIATIPGVRAEGESGLLGMALHPDFTTQPYVYLAYTYSSNGSNFLEKIVRYTFANNSLSEPLVLVDNIKGNFIHDGARLLIAPDKTLYITTGDAADQSLPQNKTSINGKTLRINLDGTIPADNPFPGSPVWSFGHRNAQGLVLSPKGIMYSSEHGPSNDDEINILSKAQNFGWPNVHGYCNTDAEKQFCTANNVVEPIMTWTPTIAVCGLDYYDNTAIPEWKNSLLLTTLKESQLILLKLDEAGTKITEQKVILTGFGRLRDVCVSPDGRIFVCTSNGGNDKIIEIKGEPTSVNDDSTGETGFNMNIFPNPSRAQSTLEFFLVKAEDVEISLYNFLGEKIADFKKSGQAGNNTFAFDLSTYSSGSYTCRLQSESKRSSASFQLLR